MGERKVMWYEFPILITIWALIVVVVVGMRELFVFDRVFVLKYGSYVLIGGFVLLVIAYIWKLVDEHNEYSHHLRYVATLRVHDVETIREFVAHRYTWCEDVAPVIMYLYFNGATPEYWSKLTPSEQSREQKRVTTEFYHQAKGYEWNSSHSL